MTGKADFTEQEWELVREGPTWHGRRVATWGELVPSE